MLKWRCFQCHVDMLEDMVELEFEGLKGSVEGIKCPECGTKYLLEETVTEKVRRAEGQESMK